MEHTSRFIMGKDVQLHTQLENIDTCTWIPQEYMWASSHKDPSRSRYIVYSRLQLERRLPSIQCDRFLDADQGFCDKNETEYTKKIVLGDMTLAPCLFRAATIPSRRASPSLIGARNSVQQSNKRVT